MSSGLALSLLMFKLDKTGNCSWRMADRKQLLIFFNTLNLRLLEATVADDIKDRQSDGSIREHTVQVLRQHLIVNCLRLRLQIMKMKLLDLNSIYQN